VNEKTIAMKLPKPNMKIGCRSNAGSIELKGMVSLRYDKELRVWNMVNIAPEPDTPTLFQFEIDHCTVLTDGQSFYYAPLSYISLGPLDVGRARRFARPEPIMISDKDVVIVRREIKNWLAKNLDIGQPKHYPKKNKYRSRGHLKGGLS